MHKRVIKVTSRESYLSNPLVIITATASMAFIGAVLVFTSKAATPVASVEAESGSLNNVSLINDSSASGNTAIKFGSGSGTNPSTCPPYPAYPDKNCTGWQHTGVTLSTYTGSLSITTAGTVIDSKDISGCLSITAPNVTIKRSRVRCSAPTTRGAIYAGSTNTLIQDTEVDGLDGDCQVLIGADSYSASVVIDRAYVHTCNDGFRVNGSFTVQDSFLDGLYTKIGAHDDGAQGYGPSGTAHFTHNRLDARTQDGSGMNSVVFFANSWDGTVYLDQNYMIGGGFSIHLRDASTYYVTNNRILENSYNYGPYYSDGQGTIAQWSNNKLINASGVDGASFGP